VYVSDTNPGRGGRPGRKTTLALELPLGGGRAGRIGSKRMNRAELAELIYNGENSGVEVKRDDIVPGKLAKEMAALPHREGGHMLLGVENDWFVSGLTRDPAKAEEWVMETARAHLRPAAIPYWETIEWSEGKILGIVSLPADAPDKPYKAKRGSAWVTQI